MSTIFPRLRGSYRPSTSALQANYAARQPVPITLPRLTFLERPRQWWEQEHRPEANPKPEASPQ